MANNSKHNVVVSLSETYWKSPALGVALVLAIAGLVMKVSLGTATYLGVAIVGLVGFALLRRIGRRSVDDFLVLFIGVTVASIVVLLQTHRELVAFGLGSMAPAASTITGLYFLAPLVGLIGMIARRDRIVSAPLPRTISIGAACFVGLTLAAVTCVFLANVVGGFVLEDNGLVRHEFAQVIHFGEESLWRFQDQLLLCGSSLLMFAKLRIWRTSPAIDIGLAVLFLLAVHRLILVLG